MNVVISEVLSEEKDLLKKKKKKLTSNQACKRSFYARAPTRNSEEPGIVGSFFL